VITTRETDESYRKGQGVPPFDAVKEITLSPDGDQTVLVLEVRGMPLDVEARWEELVPPYQDLAANIT
jgi:hypothetical protein